MMRHYWGEIKKWIVILMTIAIFFGNIDANILCAEAEQGQQPISNNIIDSPEEDIVDHEEDKDKDEDSDPLDDDAEKQETEESEENEDDDLDDEDTESDEVDENETGEDDNLGEPTLIKTMEDEGGETTPKEVKISATPLSAQIYDGSPVTYDGEIKAYIDNNGEKEFVDLEDDFVIEYTGKTANDEKYPKDGNTTEIGPTEVGEYTLTISISDDCIEYKSPEPYTQTFRIIKANVEFEGIEFENLVKDSEHKNLYKVYDKEAVKLIENQTEKKQIKARVVSKFVDLGDEPIYIEGLTQEDYDFEYYRYDEDGKNKTSISSDAVVDAGTYSLCVKTYEDNKNFSGETEIPFEILPAERTISANDVQMNLGDEVPKFGYVVKDESVESDTVLQTYYPDDTTEPPAEELVSHPTITCNGLNTEKAGHYDIIIKDAEATPNYILKYNNAILTVMAELLGVQEKFDAVCDIPNGTSLDEIPLPSSISISTNDLSIKSADVEWDRTRPKNGTYSVSNENEQTFEMEGTIVLPDYITVSENSMLDTSIQVTVREKLVSDIPLSAPTASIASQSKVVRGTQVSLTCDTSDASIYYTLDGKEPTTGSNLYTRPIEINQYTVIRAIATKKGYLNSPVAKFSYSIANSASDEEDNDVLEEDIPSSGVIPEGLWATSIAEQSYTGKAIKPTMRVYDHKKLLEEKKDYTIAYKNNVNAKKADEMNAPTVTITGKGNYEGKISKTFTISKKNISDSDVKMDDDITVGYNKKLQKPAPVITWNGKKLTNKKDYVLSVEGYKEPGVYDITVSGIGNYTGERKFAFTITNSIPVSKLTISKIPNQKYTGDSIQPQPTVKYKGSSLVLGEDYTVRYENNLEVGTATVIVKGIGDKYVGTRKVQFKIVELASIKNAKIELKFNKTPTYTGREIKVDGVSMTINLKGTDGVKETRSLIKDKDYTISYQNNIKTGTATVIFQGKGAFGGTVKKTFKILPYDIQNNVNKSFKVVLNKNYNYVKGGCKPDPLVYFNGVCLKAGTDYTVSYRNNNAVGDGAIVTVKGKGCFKGSDSKTFTIIPQNMSKLTIIADDKAFKNSKSNYKTTIRVMDVNGKQLSAGKEYDKNVIYTYVAKTKLADGTIRKADENVQKDDIVPLGTTIKVTVTAVGDKYGGTISTNYRMVEADKDISKAKITIAVQTYSGEEIELAPADIKVQLKGVTIPVSEYEIVGYSNNINKGTAKVTIHGINGYGGTKTATFKIKGKGFLKW